MAAPSLSQLLAFTAVASTGSFNAAADELGTTQPAISQQIKALESSLGVKLFDRQRTGADLSPEGRALLPHAEAALRAAQALLSEAKALRHGLQELSIAAIPTLAPYLLPAVIEELQLQRPDLRLSVSELRTSELVAAVQNGQVDLGLMAGSSAPALLRLAVVGRDEFLLAVGRRHRLAGAKSVRLEDVADEDLLLLEEGHCLREQALEVCRLAKLGRTRDVQAVGLSTICQMVAAGQGVTLLPRSAALVEAHSDRGVVALPIAGARDLFREVAFVWRENSAHASELADLVAAIAEHLPLSRPRGGGRARPRARGR